MSDAQQFPVTEGFGCQPGYPLNTNVCPPGQGFHKGIDYGCPKGTPVVVNGVRIGLSGDSGYVTGPHLHVGRWVNGEATDPGVGRGFSFESAVVTEVSSDATNGNYVRVQGDGASWVYLHLSQQLVKVGQKLEGEEIMPSASQTPVDNATAALIYNVGLNRDASIQEVTDLVNSKITVEELLRHVWASPEHIALMQSGVTRDKAIAYINANLK